MDDVGNLIPGIEYSKWDVFINKLKLIQPKLEIIEE